MSEARETESDEDSRLKHALRIFETKTLDGEGGCDYFHGPEYKGCWSFMPAFLLVDVLKGDLVVTAAVSSIDRRSMKDEEAFAEAREFADHMVSNL